MGIVAGMSEQASKGERCVVSIRKKTWLDLKRIAAIRAKQIGLARPIPATILIESMVQREYRIMAKSGLKITEDAATEPKSE